MVRFDSFGEHQQTEIRTVTIHSTHNSRTRITSVTKWRFRVGHRRLWGLTFCVRRGVRLQLPILRHGIQTSLGRGSKSPRRRDRAYASLFFPEETRRPGLNVGIVYGLPVLYLAWEEVWLYVCGRVSCFSSRVLGSREVREVGCLGEWSSSLYLCFLFLIVFTTER